MIFRQLNAEDKITWLPLWQEYHLSYCKLKPEITEHLWQQILQADSKLLGFGAFSGENQLLGFAICVIHPNTRFLTDACYLEDLFVSPQYQGQGVATFLIKQIYRFAEQKNYNRVYWISRADNSKALSLYQKLAFQTDFIQFRVDLPLEE